ncbi:hypothetical protein D3C87_2020950 [compost metagenome]
MVAPPAEYDTGCELLSSRVMRSCSPDKPLLDEPDKLAMPCPVCTLPAEVFWLRAPVCWPPVALLAPPDAPGAELA